MAQPARTFDQWSSAPSSAAAAMPAGPREGPVADLHRRIETRLLGADLPRIALERQDTVDALARAVSRLVGRAALLGAPVALALWLL